MCPEHVAMQHVMDTFSTHFSPGRDGEFFRQELQGTYHLGCHQSCARYLSFKRTAYPAALVVTHKRPLKSTLWRLTIIVADYALIVGSNQAVIWIGAFFEKRRPEM
jgi:hypothetical protein